MPCLGLMRRVLHPQHIGFGESGCRHLYTTVHADCSVKPDLLTGVVTDREMEMLLLERLQTMSGGVEN